MSGDDTETGARPKIPIGVWALGFTSFFTDVGSEMIFPLLPVFLAGLYGLAIFYASLQPFEPWLERASGSAFFLFAPWPPRWVRYDIISNLVAYLPFGFFVASAQHRRSPAGTLSVAIAAGALLSFTMEALQMFLPTRDASIADLLSNATGAALGGALALALSRSPRAKAKIRRE